MKTKKLLSALSFILVFYTFLGLGFAGDITLKPGQKALIHKLKSQGYLEVKPRLNKAYIDPALWASMKYSIKKDFAATLAIYCENVKNSDAYWVEIYDMYSGKKLAKYSRNWGFKVY